MLTAELLLAALVTEHYVSHERLHRTRDRSLGNPEVLLHSIFRYYNFLPGKQQQAFPENLCEGVVRMIRPNAAPSRLDPVSYENLRQQILRRDGWRCQSCGAISNLEVHHIPQPYGS